MEKSKRELAVEGYMRGYIEDNLRYLPYLNREEFMASESHTLGEKYRIVKELTFGEHYGGGTEALLESLGLEDGDFEELKQTVEEWRGIRADKEKKTENEMLEYNRENINKMNLSKQKELYFTTRYTTSELYEQLKTWERNKYKLER